MRQLNQQIESQLYERIALSHNKAVMLEKAEKAEPGDMISSRRPVPLHPLVLSGLLEWRAQSPYATDLDFLFPSVRFKGTRPLSPDSILEKSIRPALARIGVTGKQIGWHSFRHSLATNLRSLGVDIKVAQELMRHSSCRTTLDIYTRAVSQQKREASLKVVELMLPLDLEKFSTLPHPRRQRKL